MNSIGEELKEHFFKYPDRADEELFNKYDDDFKWQLFHLTFHSRECEQEFLPFFYGKKHPMRFLFSFVFTGCAFFAFVWLADYVEGWYYFPFQILNGIVCLVSAFMGIVTWMRLHLRHYLLLEIGGAIVFGMALLTVGIRDSWWGSINGYTLAIVAVVYYRLRFVVTFYTVISAYCFVLFFKVLFIGLVASDVRDGPFLAQHHAVHVLFEVLFAAFSLYVLRNLELVHRQQFIAVKRSDVYVTIIKEINSYNRKVLSRVVPRKYLESLTKMDVRLGKIPKPTMKKPKWYCGRWNEEPKIIKEEKARNNTVEDIGVITIISVDLLNFEEYFEDQKVDQKQLMGDKVLKFYFTILEDLCKRFQLRKVSTEQTNFTCFLPPEVPIGEQPYLPMAFSLCVYKLMKKMITEFKFRFYAHTRIAVGEAFETLSKTPYATRYNLFGEACLKLQKLRKHSGLFDRNEGQFWIDVCAEYQKSTIDYECNYERHQYIDDEEDSEGVFSFGCVLKRSDKDESDEKEILWKSRTNSTVDRNSTFLETFRVRVDTVSEQVLTEERRNNTEGHPLNFMNFDVDEQHYIPHKPESEFEVESDSTTRDSFPKKVCNCLCGPGLECLRSATNYSTTWKERITFIGKLCSNEKVYEEFEEFALVNIGVLSSLFQAIRTFSTALFIIVVEGWKLRVEFRYWGTHPAFIGMVFTGIIESIICVYFTMIKYFCSREHYFCNIWSTMNNKYCFFWFWAVIFLLPAISGFFYNYGFANLWLHHFVDMNIVPSDIFAIRINWIICYCVGYVFELWFFCPFGTLFTAAITFSYFGGMYVCCFYYSYVLESNNTQVGASYLSDMAVAMFSGLFVHVTKFRQTVQREERFFQLHNRKEILIDEREKNEELLYGFFPSRIVVDEFTLRASMFLDDANRSISENKRWDLNSRHSFGSNESPLVKVGEQPRQKGGRKPLPNFNRWSNQCTRGETVTKKSLEIFSEEMGESEQTLKKNKRENFLKQVLSFRFVGKLWNKVEAKWSNSNLIRERGENKMNGRLAGRQRFEFKDISMVVCVYVERKKNTLMTKEDVHNLLDLFLIFDEIVFESDCSRVGNVNRRYFFLAPLWENMVEAVGKIQEVMKKYVQLHNDYVKIGAYYGSFRHAIVGVDMLRYDIMGKTVEMAKFLAEQSQLSSHLHCCPLNIEKLAGEDIAEFVLLSPGKQTLQVRESVYTFMKRHFFPFVRIVENKFVFQTQYIRFVPRDMYNEMGEGKEKFLVTRKVNLDRITNEQAGKMEEEVEIEEIEKEIEENEEIENP